MKLQESLRGRDVRLLWRSFYALMALEDLAVELDVEDLEVSYDYNEGRLCVDRIEARSYLEGLNAKYEGRVRVEGPPCGRSRTRSEDLYRFVAARALMLSAPIALRTESRLLRRRGFKELALLLLHEEPVLLVLEGEEDSLTFPSPQAFVFFHTHPSGYCFPSVRDRRSFYDFFLSGGFVTGVICGKRAFLVHRLRIIGEEDDVVSVRRFLEGLPDEPLTPIQVVGKRGSPLIEARLIELPFAPSLG